jgi:hypothetical protein
MICGFLPFQTDHERFSFENRDCIRCFYVSPPPLSYASLRGILCLLGVTETRKLQDFQWEYAF